MVILEAIFCSCITASCRIIAMYDVYVYSFCSYLELSKYFPLSWCRVQRRCQLYIAALLDLASSVGHLRPVWKSRKCCANMKLR